MGDVWTTHMGAVQHPPMARAQHRLIFNRRRTCDPFNMDAPCHAPPGVSRTKRRMCIMQRARSSITKARVGREGHSGRDQAI